MFRHLASTGTLALIACASSTPDAEGPIGHRHAHGEGAEPSEHSHHAHASMHHDFSDAARWTKQFDDPARDAWQKPDEVVTLLRLEPGMVVVDVGAGTGYFEKRIAAGVGAQGKVMALDIEPNMVSFMRDRFQREGLTQAEARVCPPDSTGLEPLSADRVLIVDTWHHIGERGAYAKHLAGILRPGGLVMVVDFSLETEKGPPKKHRVSADEVVRELSSVGLDASVATETLPDQYVVIAKKKP